jgi:HEPN domain-containing protein
MPDPNDVIRVAKEWIAKAENDLKTAVHTLKLGKECPTDTVCFHAQQCIEKYLKALLICHSIAFPKTHDISVLMTLVPARLRPKIDARQQKNLTEYATVIRYPDAGTDISLAEARKAVALARRVRKDIRRHLPRAALRRNK